MGHYRDYDRNDMNSFLFVSSVLALVSCSSEEKKTSSIRAGTVPISAPARLSPQSRAPTDKSEQNYRSGARVDGWTYEKKIDKAGSPVYKASVMSSNVLRFGFPYTGGSTAALSIRSGNGGTYIYIEVQRGQFNRSFQAGNARIRFDDKPPITCPLTAAANGRANIIFFDAGQRLVDQIRVARTMSVQVKFAGQPVRQIEFRTAGLQWRHP